MTGFVQDASVTLPWCFDDEATPWTEIVWSKEIPLLFPRIGRLR